jgi:alkyl hydroperoxide reductase subunit AhpC
VVSSHAQNGRVTLEAYANRWLLLIFYPRDFSYVCPTELTAFSTRIDDFRDRDCDILAISVDSLDSHRAWLAAAASDGGVAGLRFPLGSDPDGAVASRFGVYDRDKRLAGRGLFIVDPNGVLQYQVVHNLNVGRSTDEVLRVLDALRAGGLCASGWTRADGTIDPRLDLSPGRVLGHYRVGELLGEGGFGWGYVATDLLLDRRVAVKIGRTTSKATREAVLAEARSAARLSHPNICSVFAVEDAAGVPLIVMEHLPNGTLDQRLRAGLPPGEAASIVRQVVAAIAASHAAGVVHGDIKPANILFTASGTPKVADFGMARHLKADGPLPEPLATPAVDPEAKTTRLPPDAQPNASSVILGTPAYMAPEQTYGSPPTAPADVFSTALLIYETFTGRRAVRATNQTDAMLRVRELDPVPLAESLPPDVRPVVARMLDPEPENRPTAEEVEEALRVGG